MSTVTRCAETRVSPEGFGVSFEAAAEEPRFDIRLDVDVKMLPSVFAPDGSVYPAFYHKIDGVAADRLRKQIQAVVVSIVAQTIEERSDA